MINREYELKSGAFEIAIPTLSFSPALQDDPETTESGGEYLTEIFIVTKDEDEIPLPSDLGHLDAHNSMLTIDS